LYQPTNAALPKTLPSSSPGEAERAVVRGAGGEDHRFVELLELGNRHVAADSHVADEADFVGDRRPSPSGSTPP
jgi:hypothetical protein